MIRNLLYSLLVVLLSVSLQAQTDIKIEIENYDSDTIILAHYFAEKILVTDTLFSDDQRTFNYKNDTSFLAPGMYLAVTRPAGDYYQILVNSEDQEFLMNVDVNRDKTILFEGSEENTRFYDYMNFVNLTRNDIQKIDNAIETTDSTMISIMDQLVEDRAVIGKMVETRQNEILKEFPESITSILLKSNLPFSFPEFKGTSEEIELQKYHYYKEKYFDNVDFRHPAILRTPVLDQRIEYYLSSLTPNQPDSIIISVDNILGLMDQGSDAYQYYLSNFLNRYGNSKYIGMDAVYVHLALNYYGNAKAPWVTEENLKEIVGNAKKIEPTLIGKQAPDFTLYKEDGTPVSLNDFNKDYTIIMFWKPDCGHCTKAMPHVVEFVEKFKDKSVDVLTVCTKTGKKYGDCWEGVKEKNMETLLNLGDEYHKSRIFSKYFVNSTPAIYILDKDKKIKLKKVPAENLDPVMEELMRIDAEEGRMN